MKNIPVCTAAMAWDNPDTGETFILEFNEGLWLGDTLPHSLINPNQCRAFGINVQDNPYSKDPLGIYDPTTGTHIPFHYNANVVMATTRSPTIDEINNPDFVHLVLTSTQRWQPQQQTGTPSHFDFRSTGSLTTTPHPAVDAPNDPFLDGCSNVYHRQSMAAALTTQSPLSHLTSRRHHKPDATVIAKHFGCGLDTAVKTLKATTQLGIRHAIHPLSRRYKPDILQQRLRCLNATFYTDTFFAPTQSISGSTAGQLFTNGHFTWIDPILSKRDAGTSLGQFPHDVGVPNKLVFDGSMEQMGPKTQFQKLINSHHIQPWSPEAYTHWQNKAEGEIRELRRQWRSLYRRKNIPKRLWDYAALYLTQTCAITARGPEGCTPYETITGDTPDISEYLDFGFYDWVWYWDKPGDMDNPKIGRWLGVSHRIGSNMCYYVLTTNTGQVLSRSTCQRITTEELMNNDIAQKLLHAYTLEVDGRLKSDSHVIHHQEQHAFYLPDIDVDDEEVEPLEPSVIPDHDTFTPGTVGNL